MELSVETPQFKLKTISKTEGLEAIEALGAERHHIDNLLSMLNKLLCFIVINKLKFKMTKMI
jgi:hypothetical protein